MKTLELKEMEDVYGGGVTYNQAVCIGLSGLLGIVTWGIGFATAVACVVLDETGPSDTGDQCMFWCE